MKILYIDMDGVLVNFKSGLDQISDSDREKYAPHFEDVPGMFSKMAPVDGAIESYKKLSEHFHVYILSTAPWKNPSAWSDKLGWVKKHLGHLGKKADKRLILSHHKNLNKGDYLIDDRLRHGVREFEGEHIHFGKGKFKGWDEVVEYLLTNA
jgi:5'(3')-deoxyribonucleotidase